MVSASRKPKGISHGSIFTGTRMPRSWARCTSSRTQREETDSEHHSATRALASRICRSICAAKSAPFTSS